MTGEDDSGLTAPALCLSPQTVQASVKIQALRILLTSEVSLDCMLVERLKLLALAGAW